MTVLRELIARVKLDTKRAVGDLKKYDQMLDEVAKKTEAVTKSTQQVAEETEEAAKKTERAGKKSKRSWDEIAKSAKAAAKKAGEAGKTIGAGLATVSAAVTAAAAGVFEFTTEWAEATDEIGKRAGKLGVATQGMQELRFVAELSGAEADNVSDALKEVQIRAFEAAKSGMGPFAEASEDLGLNFVELAKKSPIDAFADIRNELSKVENTTRRTALAEQLLGEQGVELGELINLTQDDFEKFRREAHDLGLVLSDETLKSAAEFNDEMTRTKAVVKGASNEVVTALLPVVQDLVVEFREWVKESDQLNRDDLAKTLGETARAGAEVAKVFGQILSLTNQVNEATGGLTNTLKALGAVAVSIKLATFGPVGIAAAALLGVKVGTDIINDKLRQTAEAEDKLAGEQIVSAAERRELGKTADGRALLARLDAAQAELDRTGTSVSALETRQTETVDEFSGAEEDQLRLDAEALRARRQAALERKKVVKLQLELAKLEREDAAAAKRAAETVEEPVFGIAGTDLDPDFVAKQKRKSDRDLQKRRKSIAALRARLQDAGKENKAKDEGELTFGELLGFGKGGAAVSSSEGRGLGTTIVNQTFNIGVPAIKFEIAAAPGATVRQQAEAVGEVVSNLGPELLKRTQRAAVGALS